MIRTTLKSSYILFTAIILFSGRSLLAGDVTIIDSRHYSNVFGEVRNFRIFLPPGYSDNPMKRYPVIYFYHGWSQRYFGSGPDSYNSYEKGDDNNGDNIAGFVARHEVIVVKPDGYNRSPGEEYYLRPYNIGPVETYRQFPLYFPELVSYIDATYRTVPDRNHRAISGLSMGGFMSFWIGGKYPQLVSAVGNFCGSAEFVVGPKDFPVEYRHIDMFKNYEGQNVRLNYGNEDFIRYYHRDLNRIWTSVMDNYEYRVYPAAHSTCGMGDMFTFLMNTFENPPNKPVKWSHIDVYPDFSVWDYDIRSDRGLPGFTSLDNVDSRGFRCSVRDHLPEGELLPFVSLSVTTPPLYKKDAIYSINDMDIRNLKSRNYQIRSDNEGRLRISLDGSSHEIGINQPGDIANLCMVSFTTGPSGIAESEKDVSLKISLLNKGGRKGDGIRAVLSATGNNCTVIKGNADYGTAEVGGISEPGSPFVFHVNSDSAEIEKFKLTISDKPGNEWTEFFEIPIYKKDLPEIRNFEIADGRVVTVAKEGIHEETMFLGRGNGDGIANPGESLVILVKDRNKLWRTNLTCKSRYVNPFGINVRHSDNWGSYDHVGGSAKYSEPLIASDCPDNQTLDFIAVYWLPDAPNHIIVQGKVNLKVSGADKTPPVLQWFRVTGDNVIQARIFDGSPLKKVTARLVLRSRPDRILDFELRDDGTGGDLVSSDNLFSFRIPEQKFGLYDAEISATDSFGNSMTETAPGIYVIH